MFLARSNVHYDTKIVKVGKALDGPIRTTETPRLPIMVDVKLHGSDEVIFNIGKTVIKYYSKVAKEKLPSPEAYTYEPLKKTVVLVLPRLARYPPSKTALLFMKDYMMKNITNLSPPAVFPPSGNSLMAHVDLYAAAETFDLIKSPKPLLQHLREYIHAEPLSANDLQYIWTHIHHDNAVVAFMVKSLTHYYLRREIPPEENANMEVLIAADHELEKRFTEVQNRLLSNRHNTRSSSKRNHPFSDRGENVKELDCEIPGLDVSLGGLNLDNAEQKSEARSLSQEPNVARDGDEDQGQKHGLTRSRRHRKTNKSGAQKRRERNARERGAQLDGA